MTRQFGMSQTFNDARCAVQLLVLERVDPTCNMARYYVLTIEPTLFGDAALVREWGRIGQTCRRRLDLHADDAAAKVALDIWLKRKSKGGYMLRAEPLVDQTTSVLPAPG